MKRFVTLMTMVLAFGCASKPDAGAQDAVIKEFCPIADAATHE